MAGALRMALPLKKRAPSTLTIAATAVPMTSANTIAALRMKGLPNSSIRMISPNTCTWEEQTETDWLQAIICMHSFQLQRLYSASWLGA